MRRAWPVVLLLLAGCGTAVRVTDATTGAPVHGAQWRCGEVVIATTDAAGRARLDTDACTRWQVSAPGYESQWFCDQALATDRQATLTPAWLHRFADGGSTATPSTQRLPTPSPCPCRR